MKISKELNLYEDLLTIQLIQIFKTDESKKSREIGKRIEMKECDNKEPGKKHASSTSSRCIIVGESQEGCRASSSMETSFRGFVVKVVYFSETSSFWVSWSFHF